jgi:hypothetical protein
MNHAAEVITLTKMQRPWQCDAVHMRKKALVTRLSQLWQDKAADDIIYAEWIGEAEPDVSRNVHSCELLAIPKGIALQQGGKHAGFGVDAAGIFCLPPDHASNCIHLNVRICRRPSAQKPHVNSRSRRDSIPSTCLYEKLVNAKPSVYQVSHIPGMVMAPTPSFVPKG